MADLVGVIVEKAVEATVGAALEAVTHHGDHQSSPPVSSDPTLANSVVVKVDGEDGKVSDLDVVIEGGKVATKFKGEGRYEVSVKIENPPPGLENPPPGLVAEAAPRNRLFSARALNLSLHGVMAVGSFATAALSSSHVSTMLFSAFGTGTIISGYFTRNLGSTSQSASSPADSAGVEDADVEAPSEYYCPSHARSFPNFGELADHYGQTHTSEFVTGCYTCERVFFSIEETLEHEEQTEHITKRLLPEPRWWT